MKHVHWHANLVDFCHLVDALRQHYGDLVYPGKWNEAEARATAADGCWEASLDVYYGVAYAGTLRVAVPAYATFNTPSVAAMSGALATYMQHELDRQGMRLVWLYEATRNGSHVAVVSRDALANIPTAMLNSRAYSTFPSVEAALENGVSLTEICEAAELV